LPATVASGERAFYMSKTGQELLPFKYGTRLFEWFSHAHYQLSPSMKARCTVMVAAFLEKEARKKFIK
jgi:hypothetical protein